MILEIYRLALETLPESFRRKYGREMELAFEEVLRGKTGLSRVATLLRALADVPRAHRLLHREKPRERRPNPMESLLNDLAHGARSLVKRPAFSLVALATLSLGIGAVTAVFSVVNGVLLKPLPYPASERIVILWHDLGNGAQTLPALNPLDFFDYRARARGFEGWTIATGRELILGDASEPAIVDVGFVDESFLPLFGVELLLGRSFSAEEDAPGGPQVAILSHRLWTGRFGSDPGIVGRTIELGGRDHEVVGVAPPSFRLKLPAEAFRLRDAEIWCPAQINRDDLPPRNYTGYTAFGKLARGTSYEHAQQEMDRLEAQLKQEHAVHEASNLQVRAVPLHGDVVKAARPTLYVLLAAVGLVLLIACGNTAQLLLARWRGGERDLTVRAAMGASRFRLTRLVVIESVVLALAAGAVGVGVAYASVRLAQSLASSVPRIEEVSLDGTVLGFAVLTSLATALFFSGVPALSLSRANLASVLAESGRASGSVRQARLRTSLIVSEVALSVVLLAATGLSIRSFAALVEAEPGFDPTNLLTLRVSLPSPELDDEDARRVFHEEMRRRLSALPGVAAVAEVNQLPLTGSGTLQPYAYDEETATNWESVTADERYVSPGFLRTMGATLLAGRGFTEDDLRLERRVAIIDEALADKAFPGEDAVGKQIRIEPLGHDDPFTEVVGVTASLKLHDLTRATLPQFYFPASWPSASFSLVVRAEAGDDEGALAAAVRDELRALAPRAAIEDVRPMEGLVADARAQARLSLVLMIAFGAVALLLAAFGLFGVLAYSVSARRTELGIRMAMGASPAAIRRDVLAEGLRVVAVSTAVGLGGAELAARWLSGVLYGVDALDGATFLGVAVVVATVALLACWVPARRATRVAPALVLRSG